VRYLRALVAFQHNDLPATAEHLDYVLRVDANHPQALLLYGAVSYAKGDYQLADDFLARLAAGRQLPVGVQKLQAATKLKLRRPKEAAELLERAVRQEPDDAQLQALLGTAYMQAGEAGKGTEALARAVELDQHDALPSAEQKISALDRQRLGRPENRRLDVSGGVVVDAVMQPTGMVGNHAIEGRQQVDADVGIVVLVYDDSGRGMEHRDVADAYLDTARDDNRTDSIRDVDALSPTRRRDLERDRASNVSRANV
jgi:tetratricopeptide (TPR) repeat protein